MSKIWLRLVPREGADASDIADVQAALNKLGDEKFQVRRLEVAFDWSRSTHDHFWIGIDDRYNVEHCTEAEALAAASGHKCVCRYCGKEN